MCVCEEDVHEKREKGYREKKEKWKQILIHTDKQTDTQTDRHKSFIDMRYYTEQYSKSNSIKENRIESIWNKVE